MRREPAALVLNLQAGRAQRARESVLAEATRRLAPVAETIILDDPAPLPAVAQACVERGYRRLLVGGGDGTVLTAARYAATRRVTLGILPLGTQNEVASSLGIATLEQAIDVIAAGEVCTLDLGRINDDYFINVATLGFTADAISLTTDRAKRILGSMEYTLAGARALLGNRRFRCRLRADGARQDCFTHAVIAVLPRFFTGTPLQEAVARLPRGLVVLPFANMTRVALARAWAAFTLGRVTSLAQLPHLVTPEVVIDTDPTQTVAVEGRPVTRTPVRLALADRALRVFASDER